MYVKEHHHKQCKAVTDLIKELEESGAERFVDKEFPANDRSVGRGRRDVVWLRATEFNETVPKLFDDGISPNDICQGELGDCYFLSSLSVLAEKPERVRKLFCHHIDNKFGLYCVTMYCDGVLTDILVDDSFPCNVKTRKPVFSHGKGPELWVLLLEKAYAKIHGSYYNIENGNAAAALSDLTGGPCFVGKVAELSDAEIWQEISLHDRLDHVMCCGVKEDPNVDLEKEVGLIERHSYALIDAKEYRGNKLFHVRNPWGKTEWKGKWSDGDTESWTPEAKRALHYEDADDGNFWIAFEDWKRYFENYTILILEEGWEYSGFAYKATTPISYLSLTTTEQTDLFLTAHLTDSDIGSRICILSPKLPYCPLGGSKETFMASAIVSSDRIRLPMGKFLIIFEVFKDHASKLPIDVIVSSYSTSDSVVITNELDEELTAASKATTFALPEFEKKYGCCGTCETSLTSIHYTVKGKKFHKYCMNCYYCGEKLTKSVALKDGHIACRDCAAGKKKIEGEPAAVKLQEEIKSEREEFNRERLPKMPSIVMHHRESEAEQAKRKISPDEVDLMELCKKQKKSAKKIRQKVSDADIRRVFSMADMSGDGLIEVKEVEALVIILGLPLSVIPKIKDLQMKLILDELDEDSSGTVDYKEFHYWMKHTDLELYSERLVHVEQSAIYFIQFLKDGDDEIHADEMKNLHEGLTKAKLTSLPYEEFCKEIDKDGSGTVSFTEFIKWMDSQCCSSHKHKHK